MLLRLTFDNYNKDLFFEVVCSMTFAADPLINFSHSSTFSREMASKQPSVHLLLFYLTSPEFALHYQSVIVCGGAEGTRADKLFYVYSETITTLAALRTLDYESEERFSEDFFPFC